MHEYSARENRETPSTPGTDHRLGRAEKAMSRTSATHVEWGVGRSRTTDEGTERGR
jgi:hypothetical protein